MIYYNLSVILFILIINPNNIFVRKKKKIFFSQIKFTIWFTYIRFSINWMYHIVHTSSSIIIKRTHTMKSNSCNRSSNYCFSRFNTAFVIPIFNEEYLNGERTLLSKQWNIRSKLLSLMRLVNFLVSSFQKNFNFLKLSTMYQQYLRYLCTVKRRCNASNYNS